MEIAAAAKLATELMLKHNLKDWSLDWSDEKRAFGLCDYRLKRIVLSRYLTRKETEAHVRDTILHEIAHALTPGSGHNRLWKSVARSIGAIPRATSRGDATAGAEDPNWLWVMVLGSDIVKGYFRRPNAGTFVKVKKMYLKGRKGETQGKLELIPYRTLQKIRGGK